MWLLFEVMSSILLALGAAFATKGALAARILLVLHSTTGNPAMKGLSSMKTPLRITVFGDQDLSSWALLVKLITGVEVKAQVGRWTLGMAIVLGLLARYAALLTMLLSLLRLPRSKSPSMALNERECTLSSLLSGLVLLVTFWSLSFRWFATVLL